MERDVFDWHILGSCGLAHCGVEEHKKEETTKKKASCMESIVTGVSLINRCPVAVI